MKKIAVFTSARSEYGLMQNVIRKLSEKFEVYLLVGGEHFSQKKGYTFSEILEGALVPIDRIIEVNFFIDGNLPKILSKTVAKGQDMFAQILDEQQFDGILLMGDRYELFAITIPAMLFRIPVFHISGGEVTEGAIDDTVRHATTKMSHLHFVANSIYAKNVSSMGEEDWRIVISGECGLDNIHNRDIASKDEILQEFGVDLNKRSALITYHPSTLEFNVTVSQQVTNLLHALEKLTNLQLIFTAPGAEIGSDIIISSIKEFCKNASNAVYVPHFGSRNYLAVMNNVEVVIGNSSSGLVEAASLNTPAVNIGNRQKNRLSAESVIDCNYNSDEIAKAIQKAISEEYRKIAIKAVNPYDPYQDGKNSERIVYTIENFFKNFSQQQRLVKKFETRIMDKEWNALLTGFPEGRL